MSKVETSFYPVKVYRWAKRPSKIYIKFNEDGEVREIHIGKPKPEKKSDNGWQESFSQIAKINMCFEDTKELSLIE